MAVEPIGECEEVVGRLGLVFIIDHQMLLGMVTYGL